MAGKLALGDVISCFLVVMFIHLLSYTEAAKEGPYDYYIFAATWPVTHCNTQEMIDKKIDCHLPILANFTIHGIFLMYEPYDVIPSYLTNSGCTNVTPMMPDDITRARLTSILADMMTYWPNAVHYRDEKACERFWKYEWKEHEIVVSKYIVYFEIGKIYPDGKWYKGSAIREAISKAVGKQPTIHCNKDTKGRLQLDEIWLCFHRNGTARSCEKEFDNCPKVEERGIKFPTAFVEGRR
ncbi:extracellular ribonuclease LE-like [Tripterygium wilfordii]|uniref:extracellular ribonuclease LE-like n=1 Tax=Tripterygium wilfordii TaxID=458696 RepID=UPI0018F8500A|nr:extracellular ribonuclease LE-like [Tripterygium wilfordii]